MVVDFAGPVGTQEPRHDAGADREGQFLDGCLAAVPLGQAVGFDHCETSVHHLTLARDRPLAHRPRAAIPGYHVRGTGYIGLRLGQNAARTRTGDYTDVDGPLGSIAGLTSPHW